LAYGEKAVIRINMTNKGVLPKTVYGLQGVFFKPGNQSIIVQNLTLQKSNKVVKAGRTVIFKYKFTPSVEPAQFGFYVMFSFYDADEPAYKQIAALENSVEVFYNDSLFDLQRFFYLI
jgi:hypothetical protein